MKKLIYILSPLLAFFLGTFWVLHVKASAAPQLSQSTLQLIEGGNSQLFQSSFSSVDVFPSDIDNAKLAELVVNASGNPTLVGAQLNLVPTTDVSIRSLSSSEIASNSEVYSYLYDNMGNPVSWDDVYFAHYDNGFCHGELYVDSSGNILTSDSDNTMTMFQLGLGGKELGVDELANIYDLIADQLNDQQMNISTSDIDLSDVNMSLYYVYGYVSGSTREAWRVYIPNAYDFGNTVATSWNYLPTNETSVPPSFLTRVRGSHSYDYIWGRAWNVSSNGYTYNTAYNLPFSLSQVSQISYSAFNSVGKGRYLMDYNGWTYNQNYADSLLNADIVTFKPLQYNGATKLLQFQDTYSYNDVSQLEQSLNNIQPTTNTSYDPSAQISSSNYPLNYPITVSPVLPSTMPFPSTSPNPGPMPDPATAPSLGDPLGDVDPNDLRSSIPVINNLLNRFPFSIPWDIYSLISGLSAQRETPYIDTVLTIPVINYDWHIQYDLSAFDGVASLFRTLFLISFVIGLAYFSYDHFFGS